VPTTGRNSHERTGLESSGRCGASWARVSGARQPAVIRRKIADFRTNELTVGLAFSPITGLWASELANLSSKLLK
jgi:hypothetical protein